MFRFRLSWLFVVTLLAAIVLTYLSQYVLINPRPLSQFPEIDGVFAAAEYIDVDVNADDRLFVRYGRTSVSGVEVERVINGKTKWMIFADSLRVEHSKYNHEVFVSIEGNEFRINSRGSSGNFHELRDLKSGKLIKRTVD